MNIVRKLIEFIQLRSLRSAFLYQGLDLDSLRFIVPDISNQYSSFVVEGDYLESNVRGMHAFQLSLVDKVIDRFSDPVIVDIGDSCGNHQRYIRALYGKKCLTVSIDSGAVARMRNAGLDALDSRAQDIYDIDIDADICTCFEVLEHLTDPCIFLHSLLFKTKYLIITVPYLRSSRIGLHHIRSGYKQESNEENTHIFELSPADWKLLIEYSGWHIVDEGIYFQYPSRGFWRIAKAIWKKYDFEGFYGLVLER